MDCVEKTTLNRTLAGLRSRLVQYEELVPCRNAFIDSRNPGSEEKENFTIIGPGVSENPEQHVHIKECHGFNIGAARQPPNCVNSQHSHETAEVFVVHSGKWTLNFGEFGEVKLPAGPGSVASIPTRLFRGFTNVGPEEGFLWVALGGDDPGQVLWAPQVFDMAGEFGLVLMEDGRLMDTRAGQPLPEGKASMKRTSAEQVQALSQPDPSLLQSCVIPAESMWNQPAGLLNRGSVDERLLIGPEAQLGWPHGFTLCRVSIRAGGVVAPHRHGAREVWFVHEGALAFSSPSGNLTMRKGDTFSVPENLERTWHADAATTAFVVRGGDQLPDVVWS
jgi:quercetin dioxygenase-like cupin family protein